jgi:hypothetical protein
MTKPKQEEYSLEGLEILNDIPKKTRKKRTLKEVIRNRRFETRFTEDELIKMKSNAKNSGMTPTEFARKRLCYDDLDFQKNDNTEVSQSMFSEKKLLTNIANNLNQMTRYSHQTGVFDVRITDVVTQIINKIGKK